jgi:excisionase family DNA binding protein
MNDNRRDQLGRLAYSVAEAAQVLGVGKTTLYALMERGDLPFSKIGSRRLIRSVALEELIKISAIETTYSRERPL